MVSQRLGTLVVAATTLIARSVAQKPVLEYCSPDLNAGPYQPASDEFQSSGWCSDHCRGSFAFAVVQGSRCWCSNYVPADQEDTSECNSGCPGIDTEWCGNPEKGLFAYYAIALGSPLGTSGDSGNAPAPQTSSVSTDPSSSSSPPSPSPSRPPSTMVTMAPSQSSARASSSRTTRATTPSSSSTSETSTSSSHSESSTRTSMTVVPSVVTVTGQVTTILVTQAPAASSDDGTLGQSSTSDGGSSGLGGGAIAGIVIGVIGGLGLIIGASLFFFCRRRRQASPSRGSSFTAERAGGSSSGQQSNSIPSRQVSQMSQAGLLGSKAPRLQTTGLGGGLGYDPRSAEPASSNVDRRSLATDQRLNPYAIYKQDDQASSVSLHDDRDYSRQLRVANPDE